MEQVATVINRWKRLSAPRRITLLTLLAILALGGLSQMALRSTLARNGMRVQHAGSARASLGHTASPGSLLWRYNADGFFGSPTVINGIEYVGVNGNPYQIYAFSAATGAVIWSYPVGYYISGAPVVVGGVVYVGAADDYVYAFNAATGALHWKYQVHGAIVDSPKVVNGVVYAGSLPIAGTNGTITAIDAATGAYLWSYSSIVDGVSFSPTIVNGIVYVASDYAVDAFDAVTGSLLWNFPINGPPSSSPVVIDGVVYLAPAGGPITALDAVSGVVRWTYQAQGGNPDGDAPPIVIDSVLYVGSGLHVYALNAASGSLLWSAQTGEYKESPVTVTDGIVYVGSLVSTPTSIDGVVYAFHAATGALLWSYQTGEDKAQHLTAPTVINGVLYVGGVDHYVYAFNHSTGSLLWSYLTSGEFFDSPAVVNGILYIGSNNGPAGATFILYALAASPPAQSPAQGATGAERLGGTNPSELNCYQACAGDPVDTYSGNFDHTFSDLSIPGRGLPLAFSHTYNAGAAAQNGPLGYGWTDSYAWKLATDGSGNVTITQENGSTVSFAPNGSGGFTPPSRVLATLVHNVDGSYTFTRQHAQDRYTFNAGGQLTAETDRNGYVTSLSYNGSGQLTTVTDPAGRTFSLTHDGSGHITQVTDAGNRQVAFAYDGSGNLQTVTDVAGGITSFTYDGNHLLLTMTDPRGGVTTNVYDGNGRVTSQTDAMNRTTTFSYTPVDGNGNSSTTITDPKGNVTLDQYYNGLLLSETHGYGSAQAATTSFTYDPLSLGVTSITDPNGNIAVQTWDAAGNQLSRTDPLGRYSTATYDAQNDLLTSTDPLGITTTNTYDAHGNLLSTATPLLGTSSTQTTTYTYGDASHLGDLTALTDPDGHVWHYAYNTNGDRTSQTDPLGYVSHASYNVLGQHLTSTSTLGFVTTFTYNAFGDTLTQTDPLGHTSQHQYDADRNSTLVTDPDGHATSNTYDLDNELTTVTRADSTTLHYSYDADGNQTAQIDGLGHTTSYAYDPLNRLVTLTDPLSRTTSYSYDAAGNQRTITAPGPSGALVTTMNYDAANQLIHIAYSDTVTSNVTLTYDADGRRISMFDGTGTTTTTYDSLGRLSAQTNGAGATISYGYDLAGRLTRLTYPNTKVVTRGYDTAGHLTSVGDWLGHTSRYSYDANGNLTAATYPNGVRGTLGYDHADQLSGIAARYAGPTLLNAPQLLFVETYTRDAAGQLLSTKATAPTQSTTTDSYTSLLQLANSGGTTYAYDAADQPTHLGTASLTTDAAGEVTGQSQGATSIAYSYDQRGNRTQKAVAGGATTSYAYNQANRLTSYTQASTSASYLYNGDELRMRKTVGATAEAFAWDTAEGLPLLLVDGTTSYITGPGGLPLEQIDASNTVLYYLHDQLGSTRVLSNAKGQVVATYRFDAYGNLSSHTGTATTPLQYAGQYTDAESGLLYLRARYYDPATGQFLSVDPLAQQTKARYRYANDDPLNLVDPTGLAVALVCITVSASLFYSGQGQICTGQGPHETIFTETVSGGLQSTPGFGATTGFQVDPAANCAKDLQGNSAYGSVNFFIVNAGTAFNTDSGGPPSYDIEFGPKTDPGFGGGTSHTWAQSGPPMPPDFTIFTPPSSLFSLFSW